MKSSSSGFVSTTLPVRQQNTQRRARCTTPTMAVQRVRNPRDFEAALPARSARLAVVNFVTSNCRACAYASRSFARVAAELAPGGKQADVEFYELNVSDSGLQKLGKKLGVSAVPSWQVYAFKGDDQSGGVGVLDEVIGARGAAEVREKVARYCAEGIDLEEYEFA